MLKWLYLSNHEYTNHFDIARFKLTWKVSVAILYALILFTITTIFLAPSYLTVIVTSLVSISLIVLLIWKTKKYELAAKLFVIIGVSISSFGLFLIQDMIHIVDLVWYLSIVIFGYFVLGVKWGGFGLLCFSVSLASYFLFMLEVNLKTLNEITISIQIFQAINAVLATLTMGYIVSHFIKTNRQAEIQLQDINADLQEKKSIIESQNDLNVMMLKEIHHRVKNNLQVISSLLRLQSNELKDDSTKEFFTESVNRISTMALIHEKLYKTDLVSVNVKSYFEDLTNELKNTYPKSEQNLQVHLKINIEELNLNTLVPLALLYNELFSNSIKHAFKEVDNAQINFKVDYFDEGKITVQYSDNGLWEKVIDENSFGLEMIETFTDQMDGKFERTVKNGTTYKFELNILK